MKEIQPSDTLRYFESAVSGLYRAQQREPSLLFERTSIRYVILRLVLRAIDDARRALQTKDRSCLGYPFQNLVRRDPRMAELTFQLLNIAEVLPPDELRNVLDIPSVIPQPETAELTI